MPTDPTKKSRYDEIMSKKRQMPYLEVPDEESEEAVEELPPPVVVPEEKKQATIDMNLAPQKTRPPPDKKQAKIEKQITQIAAGVASKSKNEGLI